MRKWAARLIHLFHPNRQLLLQLEHLLGFTPKHLPYYQLAFTHRSNIEVIAENNERLEFLGDAILGAIIAEYLFKKYPYQPEGFMTEMRSRMVRRESLNSVALRMGLNKMVQYNQNDRSLSRSHIFGNALEALVGAVYLDQGYAKTRHFILSQIVKAYMDMDVIESTDTNYKNKLLSWAQKSGRKIVYDTLSEVMEGHRKVFTIVVLLDNEPVAKGTGYNKKEASQDASLKALQALSVE